MLTEEQEAHISMFMRVANLLQKNEEIIKSVPEMMEKKELIHQGLEQIFERLTDEDKDRLLDRYKEEWDYLFGDK